MKQILMLQNNPILLMINLELTYLSMELPDTPNYHQKYQLYPNRLKFERYKTMTWMIKKNRNEYTN